MRSTGPWHGGSDTEAGKPSDVVGHTVFVTTAPPAFRAQKHPQTLVSEGEHVNSNR